MGHCSAVTVFGLKHFLNKFKRVKVNVIWWKMPRAIALKAVVTETNSIDLD